MNQYNQQNLYETYKIHSYFCIGLIVLSSICSMFLLNYNLKKYQTNTEKTFIYNNGASILITDLNSKLIKPKKNGRAHKAK
jgi:hypothetical protein